MQNNILPDEDIDDLIENHTKSIFKDNDTIILTLDDGRTIPLQNISSPPLKTEMPQCSFCHNFPDKDPLFTTNKKAFICKKCVGLAVDTLIENGVELSFKYWKKVLK